MRVYAGSIIVRLAAGAIGPTRLALILAVIALPAVVVGLPAYEGAGPPDMLATLSPLSPAVLLAILPAVLASALVAAPLGGWLERRRSWLGAVVAFSVAWIVAIVALPIGPFLAGLPYACCYLGLNGSFVIAGPASGVRAVTQGLWASPLLAPVPFVVLLVGVIVWALAIHAEARASRAAAGS
jgi:hypothetical protein